MMIAGYNLVGLVSNNGNQNNNNNENNNNENNNNNQNVNEATTDTMMGGSTGMIIVPPLPPGRALNLTRRRRGRPPQHSYIDNSLHLEVAPVCSYQWPPSSQLVMTGTSLAQAWLRIMVRAGGGGEAGCTGGRWRLC